MRLDDLVIRGARERLREMELARQEGARNAEVRLKLIERLRSAEGIDVDAAYEVRERGWTH